MPFGGNTVMWKTQWSDRDCLMLTLKCSTGRCMMNEWNKRLTAESGCNKNFAKCHFGRSISLMIPPPLPPPKTKCQILISLSCGWIWHGPNIILHFWTTHTLAVLILLEQPLTAELELKWEDDWKVPKGVSVGKGAVSHKKNHHHQSSIDWLKEATVVESISGSHPLEDDLRPCSGPVLQQRGQANGTLRWLSLSLKKLASPAIFPFIFSFVTIKAKHL